MTWLSHKDCWNWMTQVLKMNSVRFDLLWNWMTQVLKMNSVRFDLLLDYQDMMKHSLAYSDL